MTSEARQIDTLLEHVAQLQICINHIKDMKGELENMYTICSFIQAQYPNLFGEDLNCTMTTMKQCSYDLLNILKERQDEKEKDSISQSCGT